MRTRPKIDLFREKLPRSPIANFFPDYTGGTDLQAACDYFSSRFVSLNQSSAKQIYVHFTCATVRPLLLPSFLLLLLLSAASLDRAEY